MSIPVDPALNLITVLKELEDVDIPSLNLDSINRLKALYAARALCIKLEAPLDTIRRLAWHEPAFNAALKIAFDLKVFDILADGTFHNITDLAAATGADAILLHRIMRHLAAMGAVREKESDSYGSTLLTDGLRKNTISGGLDYWFDFAASVFSHLPTYVAKNGYKDLTDPKDGNWQFAKKTQLQFFEWLNENPKELASFSHHMAGYASDRGSWIDVYPTERIIDNADAEGSLFVDVGGGMGQDTGKFQKKHPQGPGRLIVQDQPLVIANGKGKVDGSIKMIAHDFFTEQPVKNARTYFLHSVLHDWNDEKAIDILRNLRPAFKRGYSKLLLNESVIPATGANPHATSLDMIMMAFLNGRERDQADWERLLEEAGFRITGIWTSEAAYESVIEAELA